LFGGGWENPGRGAAITYVTIASTGNSVSFGNLTVARYGLAACSSETRGVFGGGEADNVIDYVTIASTGNALDFGDLTADAPYPGACSNTHGGL
jgi:hypothetical protein